MFNLNYFSQEKNQVIFLGKSRQLRHVIETNIQQSY